MNMMVSEGRKDNVAVADVGTGERKGTITMQKKSIEIRFRATSFYTASIIMLLSFFEAQVSVQAVATGVSDMLPKNENKTLDNIASSGPDFMFGNQSKGSLRKANVIDTVKKFNADKLNNVGDREIDQNTRFDADEIHPNFKLGEDQFLLERNGKDDKKLLKQHDRIPSQISTIGEGAGNSYDDVSDLRGTSASITDKSLNLASTKKRSLGLFGRNDPYICTTANDLIGKDFTVRVGTYRYKVTNLGQSGSKFERFRWHWKTSIGVYKSKLDSNTISYKSGSYCRGGKRYEGKFKVVQSSGVKTSKLSVRGQRSLCYYEMVLTIPICTIKTDPSTQSLLDVLKEFETEARVCNEDGLALAEIIEDDIIKNLKLVNPLKAKIDKISKKFETIYKKRKLIKKIAKMVPKVGKMIIIVVEKIEALYVGFKNFSNSLKKYVIKYSSEEWKQLTGIAMQKEFTIADGLIHKLKLVHDLLAKELKKDIKVKKEKLTKLSVGVGLAHQAGAMADAAKISRDVIQLAETCSSRKAVGTFSKKVLDEMTTLRDAAQACSTIRNAVSNMKLSFLSTLYEIIDKVNESIEPVISLIEEILDTVASSATEAACCTIPPHAQAAVQAISAVVDFGTCFAGPMEGLLDDLLRELVPDVKISHELRLLLPLIKFTFIGIEFNEDSCKLDLETPSIISDGIVDLDFSFNFDLYEYLGIEDDGKDFLDDLSQSCDPNQLVNDLSNAWGGDCCCTARDIIAEPGTFCLDFIAFALPASYEIAAAATGLERCTCCENGVYSTEGCKGQTGYCGTSAPPNKNVGDLCPSTVDCECGLDGLECGKRNYWDQDTYICCKKTFVPAGWTTDLCVTENEGDRCGTTEDAECAGSMGCARKTASDKDKNNYRCCKRTGIFDGFDYCLDMEDGSSCWSDAQCKSGLCKGNWGGTKRGVCTKKKNRGESCDINSDCKNNACARANAITNAKKCCHSDSFSYWEGNGKDYCNGLSINERCHEDSNCKNGACGRGWYGTDKKKCCKSGRTTRYWANLKDYCTGMPDNHWCRTDAMCASKLCLNNRCTRKKSEGQNCPSEKNAECHNRSCYRSTRNGNYKCCKDTNFCDAWDGGCTTGYYYCDDYGDKLG